jgi:prepilin-type N-terminal cleavage/methylation domain-containing protein
MINLRKKKQTGFTLLELIVVIGLLGLVTSLASDFVINETNQQRFETTKQRMEKIRYAIIGDSSRSLNGQPTISGFIADTGRVPASIENLMSNVAYCSVPTAFNQVDCVALAAYPSTSDATWNIGYCSDDNQLTETNCVAQDEEWNDGDVNWKGPYLRPTGYKSICDSNGDTISKIAVFRDGWGNQTNNDCQVLPDKNYGWEFANGTSLTDDLDPSSVVLADIKLQSLGLGGEKDEEPNINGDKYEDDSPVVNQSSLVPLNEFSIEGKELDVIYTNATNIKISTKNLFGINNSPDGLPANDKYTVPTDTIFQEVTISYGLNASSAESTIVIHKTSPSITTIKLP